MAMVLEKDVMLQCVVDSIVLIKQKSPQELLKTKSSGLFLRHISRMALIMNCEPAQAWRLIWM